MGFANEEELEERMSRPSAADIGFAAKLDGDVALLGVGGKMGPTLGQLIVRSAAAAGKKIKVYGVARFSDAALPDQLRKHGMEPVTCDLLERRELDRLPDSPNVIYLAARKFGTTGKEHFSWAINTQLPSLVAERYRDSRIVCFSSGNVYPLMHANEGGATESTPPGPVGEYAQSVLGRERIFEHASHRWGTRVAFLRLNYAVDLRYGVLVDIARSVYEERPVTLSTGLVNVIWQGDANSVCMQSLGLCSSPPFTLNVTGPETLSTRWLATEFAARFGKAVQFDGEPGDRSLLNNATACHRLFGYPQVPLGQLMDWVADWIVGGGRLINKPTHFQVQDGKF